MRKKNLIHYRNWCTERLKEIHEEQNEIHNMDDKEKTAFYGDTLRDLYLDERYYEGQISACTYLLNNC